ncbi:SDR family oxidoreductase [Corynebacterium sp. 335C]
MDRPDDRHDDSTDRTAAARPHDRDAGGVGKRPAGPRTAAPMADAPVAVTGAASGIGRALALSFLAEGRDVAACDRDAAGLADLAALTERSPAATGRLLDATALDVSDHDAVHAWARRIIASYGTPGEVHHVAGTSAWGDPRTLPHATWRRMVDVNLMGTVHVVEAFAAPLCDAGRGRLVFVSSSAGYLGLPWHAAYSASKAGVLGLAEVLRFDLAPHGVDVHVVAPGAVDTALVRTIDIEGVDRSAPRVRRATELFRRHAITPAQAAAVIRTDVDRGRFLVTTSPDVAAGRWAQLLAPGAYRAAMRGLNRGLRWAVEGALTQGDARDSRDDASRSGSPGGN